MADPIETVETGALANAGDIIERFGGIRPMASKMAVPVTTVQGWKKRGVIPGNRRVEVLRAAAANGIDLGGLDTLQAASTVAAIDAMDAPLPPSFARYDDDVDEHGIRQVVADEGDDDEDDDEDDGDTADRSSVSLEDEDEDAFAAGAATSGTDQSPATFASALHDATPSPAPDNFDRPASMPRQPAPGEIASVSPGRILARSALISALMIGAVAAAGGAYGAMKLNEFGRKVAAVEARVGALDKRMAMLESHPATDSDAVDVQQKLSGLEDQITTLSARVPSTGTDGSAPTVAAPAPAPGPAVDALAGRVAALEGNVAQLTSVNGLTILSDWLRQLQRSPDGQQQLTAAVRDLTAHASSDAAATLSEAHVQGTLGEILNNLNPATRKSGLLLVGLADLNNARQRGAPFDSDIRLLQALLGDAVPPDLKTQLAQLDAASKQGVPTQAGLQDQLKGLESSINAAGVTSGSYKDRALAKLGALVQVSKDGQPVGGTDAQGAVARAEALLDKGDIMGAVVQMKKLTGPAAAVAKPFVAAAETALAADRALANLSAITAGSVGVGATVHTPASAPATIAAAPATGR